VIDVLVDLTAKATLLCVAAAVVTLTMRRSSAASRHLVWTGMFAAVLALPVARVVVPGLPVLVLAPPVRDVVPTAPRDVVSIEIPASAVTRPAPSSLASAVERDAPAAPAVVVAPVRRGLLTLRDVVLAVWLAGVCLLLLRAAAGWTRVRRLNRSASAVTDAEALARVLELRRLFNVRRAIAVRAYSEWMPMTWGVVRPVILAPAATIGTADGRYVLDSLLVHEIAHIARFDVVAAALARIAVAIGWFNPLLWLAARQARLERERACDDAVLTMGADLKPSDYANQLMVLAQAAPSGLEAAHVMAMARQSQLESRIRAILDARMNRRSPSRISRVVAVLLVIVAVPVAAVRLAARTIPATPIGQRDALASERRPTDLATPIPAAMTVDARDAARSKAAEAVVAVEEPQASVQQNAPPPVDAQPQRFVIGVGDSLRITVWNTPELSGDLTVGTDGKVALPRGNPVQAAGLTVGGFRELVTAELKRCCQANPVVLIELRVFGRGHSFFFFNAPESSGSRPSDLAQTPPRSVQSNGACTTPDPFVNIGGGRCVNGEWLAAAPTVSFLLDEIRSQTASASPREELVQLMDRLIQIADKLERDILVKIEIGTAAAIDKIEPERTLADLQQLMATLRTSPPPSDEELRQIRTAYTGARRSLEAAVVRFSNGLTPWSAVHDALMSTAAVLRIPALLSDAELLGALRRMASIVSDRARADELVAVAQANALTPEMVALYVAAANGIVSDTERARVFAQPIRVKGK